MRGGGNNIASPPAWTLRGNGCPEGDGVVREDTAAALVTDVMTALHLRGHDVRVTAENGPRLLRLGALMLDGFGVGTTTESTEEDDDRGRQ